MPIYLKLGDLSREPCFECGSRSEHDHHVIPRSRGGTKTVPLCSECHGLVHGVKMSATSTLTTAGLKKAKGQGAVLGGSALGWKRIDEVDDWGRQKVEPVDGEMKIVNEIINRRHGGEVLRSIADDLNTRGIKTKLGGRWYPSTVTFIISRTQTEEWRSLLSEHGV